MYVRLILQNDPKGIFLGHNAEHQPRTFHPGVEVYNIPWKVFLLPSNMASMETPLYEKVKQDKTPGKREGEGGGGILFMDILGYLHSVVSLWLQLLCVYSPMVIVFFGRCNNRQIAVNSLYNGPC